MLDYTMISSIVSYHTKSLIYGMIYRRSTAYPGPIPRMRDGLPERSSLNFLVLVPIIIRAHRQKILATVRLTGRVRYRYSPNATLNERNSLVTARLQGNLKILIPPSLDLLGIKTRQE